MQKAQLKATVGALLHDIGKILNDKSNHHSISGATFVEKNSKVADDDILDQIRYHHKKQLSETTKVSDYAYVTNFADTLSAKMDGRKKDDGTLIQTQLKPLESIFNILNGNNEKLVYNAVQIKKDGEINYPVEKAEVKANILKEAKEDFEKVLKNSNSYEELASKLLTASEKNLSFLPAAITEEEINDISLFDHLKMTAAIASSVRRYMDENKIIDFKSLLDKELEFMDKKMFLLYSIDVSGIQDFIYTIATERVLKGLRTRSFYLEMVIEHCIDTLFETTGFTRANLIYSGGGHAYVILPNTDGIKEELIRYENWINDWFMEYYKTDLYIASGYSECSANSFCNNPEGSYKEIFAEVSKKISEKKMKRYSADVIRKLNSEGKEKIDAKRECKVCHRMDMLTNEDKCEICSGIENMSQDILDKELFAIICGELTKNLSEKSLPLPFGCSLVALDKEEVNKLEKNGQIKRVYSKNSLDIDNSYIKIWIGDYHNGETFEELAKESNGIKRLAVMRADVDNLGQAFVSGFEAQSKENKKIKQKPVLTNKQRKKNKKKKQSNNKVESSNIKESEVESIKDKYVTLSRTATFSRKLSMFFKLHINEILENGEFTMSKDKKAGKRNALIVYSGGDDLFIIGSWDDIIEFSIDLTRKFKEFSQKTLTVSAGIDLYPEKYPISVMANKTGELEDISKGVDEKNAVTIAGEENLYKWIDLEKKVIEEKYSVIENFLKNQDERGNSFIYNILELYKYSEEKRINIARLAYLISRLEPKKNKSKNNDTYIKEKENYLEFAKKIYEWIKNKEDNRQTRTAILLYVYNNRNQEVH